MEVKINKEIRNYTESMFFGLSLRQFIFSVLACGVAVGLYFLLRPRFGTETLSWVCAEIDEAARNRMELIVRSLAEQNGVTEQLKAENQMEWVRQMNACKAQAEEVVKAELIYN